MRVRVPRQVENDMRLYSRKLHAPEQHLYSQGVEISRKYTGLKQLMQRPCSRSRSSARR